MTGTAIRRTSIVARLLRGAPGLLVAASIWSAPAFPARADAADAFTGFYGYVKQGYDIFNQYIADQQPSDLAQMKAAINQAKTQIIAELDGLTAAWNSSCAANSVDTFQNIDKLTPDNLQAFAVSSDKCVTDAQAQIGAVTSKAAIDKIGFALNTVGPIALLANAHAGFATNVLRQHIIDANQQLRTKLAPTCDVSIDNPDALPSFGKGPVTGHGACYNYTVATPPRIRVGQLGGVFYLTPGPGRAFLSWPVREEAIPEDDLFPWRGYTAYGPREFDFSIAISQVMQGTSWQIASAALDQLLATAGPAGSPVALTKSTDTISKPLDVFRTDANDNAFRGVLNPYPDGSNPAFAGWHQVDGALRSVAAAANSDGRVEIFGISRIGNIFHRWQEVAGDDTSWSPWAQMDLDPGLTRIEPAVGPLNSITLARNKDGTLQVFGTNPAGNTFTRNQILGGDQFPTVRPPHPAPATDSWTSWKQMDGALAQAAAVTNADGQVQLFGINSVGALFHRQQTAPNATDPSVDGAWTGWDQVQTPAPLSSIAATTDLGGRVNIFGITTGDQLFQRVKLGDGTVYTGWAQIPGAMHDIAAIKEGGGSGPLLLIGIDANGNIYRNTSSGLISQNPNGWIPAAWKGWVRLPIALGGNPVLVPPGNQSTVLGAWASLALSVSGGTFPYTWTVSGLPPGLSLDGNSIAGFPATPGSFAISAMVTDSVGEKSEPVSFTWTATAIMVPNVIGATRSQAADILFTAGLSLGNEHEVVDCASIGVVVNQIPDAGSAVPIGSRVDFFLGVKPSGHMQCP
jgi:hypothetical protein